MAVVSGTIRRADDPGIGHLLSAYSCDSFTGGPKSDCLPIVGAEIDVLIYYCSVYGSSGTVCGSGPYMTVEGAEIWE